MFDSIRETIDYAVENKMSFAIYDSRRDGTFR